MARRKKSAADRAPFCVRGAIPDLRRLYRELREMWKDKEEGRTFKGLATVLNVTNQNVSQWATGSGDKGAPPMWVMMRLCEELDLVIVAAPHYTRLYPTPTEEKPAKK